MKVPGPINDNTSIWCDKQEKPGLRVKSSQKGTASKTKEETEDQYIANLREIDRLRHD